MEECSFHQRRYHRQVRFFKNKEKERNLLSCLNAKSPIPFIFQPSDRVFLSRKSKKAARAKAEMERKNGVGFVIPVNHF